ncbi:hypothetical protein D3C84_495090 [compost metagenome]
MLGMPNTPSFCSTCISRKASKNSMVGSPLCPMMFNSGRSRRSGPMNWYTRNARMTTVSPIPSARRTASITSAMLAMPTTKSMVVNGSTVAMRPVRTSALSR